MSSLQIQNFSGMMPLRDPMLLENNYAQYCTNTFLYKGAIRGFREDQSVHTIGKPAASSVYRIPSDTNVKQNFANSIWLEFQDLFTSVIRAPMIEDQFERYYFFPSSDGNSSPGAYYNTKAQLAAGLTGWSLGVIPPVAAPAVVPPSGTDEVRAYVYTYLTNFSEESAPSPVTVSVSGASVGTWGIGFPAAPVVAGKPTIETINIYREVEDTSGNVNFYLVGQIPASSTSFSDVISDANAVNNPILPSLSWTPPPADLEGVVIMANGILAGWSNKKEIWFCEPYHPHAWPPAYAVTVPYPVVALAAVGSSLSILTEGRPQMATGATPATMTIGEIAANEPCISRGSVVAAGEGVYYASPNGLILLNSSGTSSVSQNILTKEDWIKADPYDFSAGKYSQAYVAFIRNTLNSDNGLVIDHGAYSLVTSYPAALNTPFTWLSLPGTVTNVYNDELSGQTFYISANKVYQWNPETGNILLPWIWHSKDFRFPYPNAFIAGNVLFDIPPEVTIPAPTSHNTDQGQTYDPTKQYLLMRVYADKRLVYVREFLRSGEIFKLPSGFKADIFSFQFEGIVSATFFQVATSVKELRGV